MAQLDVKTRPFLPSHHAKYRYIFEISGFISIITSVSRFPCFFYDETVMQGRIPVSTLNPNLAAVNPLNGVGAASNPTAVAAVAAAAAAANNANNALATQKLHQLALDLVNSEKREAA